jgi:drug/metabolite transporter (DMT)-like permease
VLKSLRAEIYLVCGAIFFAFNGIVSKIILATGLSAMRLTQIRCTGAFTLLLIFVLIRRNSSLRTSKRELPYLIAYGVIGFAAVQTGYFIAIARMHVSVALIIEFTAPIWIVLYIRFIRKREVPALMWVSLAMAFSGLLLLAQVWKGMTLDGIGLLAAFLDAFALAAYFLLGEKLVTQRPTDTLTVWGLGIASLWWAIITPVWSFPFHIFTQKVALLGRFSSYQFPGWVIILWIVIMGTIVPYMFVLTGLKSLSASTSSTIGMLEPVVAGGFAWWWLRETFSLIQLLGAVIVIAGIILADRARRSSH